MRTISRAPKIGSVIAFKYFELTKDKIPRFPTFLRIRPDVDANEFTNNTNKKVINLNNNNKK